MGGRGVYVWLRMLSHALETSYYWDTLRALSINHFVSRPPAFAWALTS